MKPRLKVKKKKEQYRSTHKLQARSRQKEMEMVKFQKKEKGIKKLVLLRMK